MRHRKAKKESSFQNGILDQIHKLGHGHASTTYQLQIEVNHVRKIIASCACCALLLGCASVSQADDWKSVRRPLGVYAHLDIETAINNYPGSGTPTAEELHSYLRNLYASMLADRAISGITLGAHWDNIQLTDPALSYGYSDGYDWSYLDEAFEEANFAHKSIQLIITPGFDSPKWLLAETKIHSCDGLFPPGNGTAPDDCGTVTFVDYPESDRADGNVLPLPWNSVYKEAWLDFLTHLNARYDYNPAFVSIAIAGPVGASTEIILPTDGNTPKQPSGKSPDEMWTALINHSFPYTSNYQDSDQVFIDQWRQVIDAYEKIFRGVTLFISPDAGNDLPEFSENVTPHHDNTLFAQDCKNAPGVCHVLRSENGDSVELRHRGWSQWKGHPGRRNDGHERRYSWRHRRSRHKAAHIALAAAIAFVSGRGRI